MSHMRDVLHIDHINNRTDLLGSIIAFPYYETAQTPPWRCVYFTRERRAPVIRGIDARRTP
jgi:hypothetical protein